MYRDVNVKGKEGILKKERKSLNNILNETKERREENNNSKI
jgi:hypothetical protein